MKLLKLFILTFITLIFNSTLSAQINGEYRSSSTGLWDEVTTWQTYNLATTSWVSATVKPAAGDVVNVINGHTVTIDGSEIAKTVRIENGAVLKAEAGPKNLKIQEGIYNEGSYGGSLSSEHLDIEGYAINNDIVVTGTGAYWVAAIRCNGIVQTVNLIIDADISMNGYLRAPYTLNGVSGAVDQGDDVVNIIINAGKTVTMTSSVNKKSYLHGSSDFPKIDAANIPYGKYTYTINGTLDMSVTKTSCFVEKDDQPDTTTLKVNGLLKLGATFRTAASGSSTPQGTVKLIIGDGGVVDAATAGTNLVMTNSNIGKYSFFETCGNGALMQNPSSHGSQVLFRVGKDGVYSPVQISNTVNDNVLVSVKEHADGGIKVVNRVWNISSTNTVSNITLGFGSVANVEKNGFNTTDPVLVYKSLGGGSWDSGTQASTSGGGIDANPHYAEITGVNTLGSFSVGNETPLTLSLRSLSFVAKVSPNPASEILNVNYEFTSQNGVISVYSLAGIKLITQSIKTGSSHIALNIDFLTSAIYIIELKNGENVSRQRFVKK